MGACGSVRNYSIPEICIVRGNLVCVQSIWTVRKFSICHNYIAGNHLCGCGYVAAARRNGNQRTVIFKNIFTGFWKSITASGNAFKPWTWILYRIIDQCNFHDRGEFYNRKKLKEESINKWRVILIRIKTRGK